MGGVCGWGRMGSTHICLAKASEDVLGGALRTAWKLRLEKNTRTKKKKTETETKKKSSLGKAKS